MSYRGRGGGDRGGGGFRGGRGGGGGGGRGGRGGFAGAQEVRVFKDPNAPAPAVDMQLMGMEDSYMKATKSLGALSNLSVSDKQMPSRPGHGTLGKRILVYANYFRVNVPKELTLTRYNVEVTPEVKGKKLGRIFQLLLELPEFAGVATEWKSFIVSPRKLNIPDDFTVQIPYKAEGQDEPLTRAITYTVRVVTPLSFSVSDLVGHLSSTKAGSDFVQKAEIIQVLNAVFGDYPQSHDGVVSIGQNRHFSIDRSPQNSHNIKILTGGLESIRGYFQSIRPATGGLLLNVNVTHGVFFEPIVLSMLLPKLGSANRITLQKKLRLVRVNVIHLPAKKSSKTGKNVPRVKTIFGLAHVQDGHSEEHPPKISSFGAGPKDVQFWLAEVPPTATKVQPPTKGKAPQKGNTYISVFNYFRQKYPQIQLNDRLPVINVGNRDHPSYLPAEVCAVLPGQTIKRRLSPEQTQNMIQFACRKPWENANSIVGDGKAVLGLNASSKAKSFGLTVGTSLITVAARMLSPPSIKYKNAQNKEHTLVPRGGSWNMANIKFHLGSNLGPWTYVEFRSNQHGDQFGNHLGQTVVKFRDFLVRSGVNAGGLITPPPPFVNISDGEEDRNDASIGTLFRMLYNTTGKPRPRFVLCILPKNDVAIYNSIKTYADTKAGIHTICVVGSKFMKEQRQDQYFGNISLKFNLKAGGINQVLEPAKMGIVGEGKTMVVGIDVTHPSPGSKEGAPSAAAIVASVDRYLAQWPATCSIQESKKEMVSGLDRLFFSRLELWRTKNSQLPENVIIYRDGVSEGQFEQVLDLELPLIRNACRRAYPATATEKGVPKISIIICGKRHHVRFYPTVEANADRSSNCEPGTVVDRGVTDVRFWNFFLQAHACLQGTARPCHYYVILDEVFRSRAVKPPHANPADALEELTNNMCHLFGRATKAVSLCPPAYYADLLCTRLRCYLSDQFDPNDSSATQSVASGAAAPPIKQVEIPANIHDTMFYI